MDQIRPISREELPHISLGTAPILGDEARITRWKDLHRATFIGNLREEKVTFFLQGAGKEVLQMETTLWACTQEWAVFKEGQRIPVESIIRVAFHQASEE